MIKKFDRVLTRQDLGSHFQTAQRTNPTVVLINPKFPHNIGNVMRACAAFGVYQLWFSGDRALSKIGKRIPREERMKGYNKVSLIREDRPLTHMHPEIIPVCIEIAKGAMPLSDYIHPTGAVYVFGPEDGSVPSVIKRHCHQFVYVESAHCLNLAATVNIVLYHRALWFKHAQISAMPKLDEVRGYA